MKRDFSGSHLGHLLIIVVFSWIVLAVIFGIFDLDISLKVVDEKSLWGNFGAKYGELPGYGLISIALPALIGGYVKDLKRQKIPGYFSIAIGIIYMFYAVLKNDADNVIMGIFLSAPVIAFTVFTWNKDWKNYRSIAAVISILAILNPFLLVQSTKLFFGRVRFGDLATDYSNFTSWFLPQGMTGNFSFLSGHTAMGFMFLPLLIPVRDLQWKDIRKILTIILVVGWGLFVGASRVVVGAHYASDVLFSAGAAAIITILLYRKYYVK